MPVKKKESKAKYKHMAVRNKKHFKEFRVVPTTHIFVKDLKWAMQKKKLSKLPKGTKVTVGKFKVTAPKDKGRIGKTGKPRAWGIQNFLIPKPNKRKKNPGTVLVVNPPKKKKRKKNSPKLSKKVVRKHTEFHGVEPKTVKRYTINDGKKRKKKINFMQLGKCVDFDFAKNGQEFRYSFGKRMPTIYTTENGKKLIISFDLTKINNKMKRMAKVTAVSYKPMNYSNKSGTYIHRFGSKKPSIYHNNSKTVFCIKGGSFIVKDWIHK